MSNQNVQVTVLVGHFQVAIAISVLYWIPLGSPGTAFAIFVSFYLPGALVGGEYAIVDIALEWNLS